MGVSTLVDPEGGASILIADCLDCGRRAFCDDSPVSAVAEPSWPPLPDGAWLDTPEAAT